MSEILLSVNDLKTCFSVKSGISGKSKKVVHAVDGVSLHINKGEIVGLVGESGSGKTTVGKTIIDLVSATSGSAYFEDKCIFDVEKGIKVNKNNMEYLRRNIQMIFQDPYSSLDSKMNIEKIITEGIVKFKCVPKKEVHAEAERLITMCGLDVGSLKKYPNQFSGGQRQRVGIARALSLNPKLIICDEPTAALDVSIQSQILNLMISLKNQLGMSYLFISHNLDVVEHFCDRVYVIYLGRVVECASAQELFDGAAHPYSRALLSSAPSINKEKAASRMILKGEIPSPMNPPTGCCFHPRCEKAIDLCSKQVPDTVEITPGHCVACHMFTQT